MCELCRQGIKRELRKLFMCEINGRLENWRRSQVTNKEFVLYGNIYDDKDGRFSDGEPIHTSGIKNRTLKEGDIIETRNSKYLLGKQLNT